MKKIFLITLCLSGIINAGAQEDFADLQDAGYLKGTSLQHMQQLSKICRNGDQRSCKLLLMSLKELEPLCTTKVDKNAPIEEFAKRNFACPRFWTLLNEFGVEGLKSKVEGVIEDTLMKTIEHIK